MKNCPHCNAQIGDTASFCIHCMTSLEEKNSIGAIKNKNKGWLILIAAILVLVLIFLSSVIFLISAIINSGKKEPSPAVSKITASDSSFISDTASEYSVSVPAPISSQAASNSSLFTETSSQQAETSYLSSLSSNTSASDTDDYYYTIENGEATLTGIDTDLWGDVTIPSSLGGAPVVRIAKGALSNMVSSVVIPQTVREIEAGAFEGSSLKSVVLKCRLTRIEGSVFKDCQWLSSIYLPNSLKQIDRLAFDNCKNLTDIYFEGSREQKEALDVNLETAIIPTSQGNAHLLNAAWHYNCRF